MGENPCPGRPVLGDTDISKKSRNGRGVEATLAFSVRDSEGATLIICTRVSSEVGEAEKVNLSPGRCHLALGRTIYGNVPGRQRGTKISNSFHEGPSRRGAHLISIRSENEIHKLAINTGPKLIAIDGKTKNREIYSPDPDKEAHGEEVRTESPSPHWLEEKPFDLYSSIEVTKNDTIKRREENERSKNETRIPFYGTHVYWQFLHSIPYSFHRKERQW